jgi:hypothetical protein
MFLGATIQTTQEEDPIPAGGPQEVVCTRCVKHDCKSLPQSSGQTVRQTSVSLITPKSRWYKSGNIVPTYTLFACADSSPHTSPSPRPSIAFVIYSFPTVLVQPRQTSHCKNFCSSLSFLSELIRSNRRRRQQGVLLGSTRRE